MNREHVRFHIMVPVYKVEKYLEECIESVLGQTHRNFELLLMDDGSPDRCGEICDAYAAKDPRVRVFHKENEGLLHTRRRLIAQADEDGYGIFLDSDDYLLSPDVLETIAKAIEAHGCDCVIYGARRVIGGKPGAAMRNISETPEVLRDKRQLYHHVMVERDGDFYALWRKAVRMEALKRGRDYAPYYHVAMFEDRLQSLDIYKNCGSFCFLPDALYGYRLNPASITRKPVPFEKFRVDFTVQQEEEAFLKEEGVFSEEDFAAYYSGSIHELAGSVVRAANVDTSRKNKAALLEQIRATEFARKHLGGAYDRKRVGKIALIYELFRRKRYGLLLTVAAVYGKLRTR